MPHSSRWHNSHGEGSAAKGYSAEYRAWRKMRSRCRAKEGTTHHRNYVQRGIKVCKRWDDYSKFLADMGRKPSPEHTIERRDNSKGYEPANCYWADIIQQARNKRSNRVLAVDGIRRTTTEWAEIMGVRPNTIAGRLSVGWSDEDAVKTPPNSRPLGRLPKLTEAMAIEVLRRSVEGETPLMLGRAFKVSEETIRRVKIGLTYPHLRRDNIPLHPTWRNRKRSGQEAA